MKNNDNDLINEYYNDGEQTIKIHTYKQFIKEDLNKNKNIKVINENYIKKAKKDLKLDYDKIKKNKYNIEYKDIINKINKKYLSSINEIKCKDILI